MGHSTSSHMGKRAHRRMRTLRITQAHLATRLGISKQRVSTLLGQQSWLPATVEKVSRALGVQPEYFFGLTNLCG